MFRGGPVSSYGTGIADGLGTPRVGLDKGGTWWDRFQNWTSRNVPAGEGITGAEVVEGAKWMQDGKKIYGPFSPYGEKATIEDMVGTGYNVGRNVDEDSINLEYLYSGAEDPTLESSDVFMKEWVNEDAVKRQEYKTAKEEFEANPDNKDKTFVDQETFEAIERENKGLDSDSDLGLGGSGGEKILKTGKSELELENERLRKIIEEGAGGDDPTNVETGDLESMIARYEKLLGGDKAFSQDVGDMAFRLAGAKGDTVWEKIQNWFGDEAKAGPSRTEKIKQTAAMLGIKGEQAQKLYETKLKNVSGSFQKKVEQIMKAKDLTLEEATNMALGLPGGIDEAVIEFKKRGTGLMTEGEFDMLARSQRISALPNVDISQIKDGKYYKPGEKTIVTIKDKTIVDTQTYE
jgi:hypothetical protein